MARACRLGGKADKDNVFPVTHRRHNRAFLLKFVWDRDAHWEKPRKHLDKFEVWLLDYCVASNHVHLLIDAQERFEMSRLMQEVASEFA